MPVLGDRWVKVGPQSAGQFAKKPRSSRTGKGGWTDVDAAELRS